jgi:lipoate-protein ligase A
MNWGIVRRPTGGRAILHADELTYSISALVDDTHIRGGVIESYKKISRGLIRALEILGLKTDSKIKSKSEKNLASDPICFQYPSDYEITFKRKKLIGSAQARRKNGLLQHGAIPLHGDISRIVSTLAYATDQEKNNAKMKLLSRATTIQAVKGERISWEKLANAISKGFEEIFNIRFVESELSKGELEKARELQKIKYLSKSWTYRV